MKKFANISLITENDKLTEKVFIEIKNNKINYQEKDLTDVLYDIENEILIRDNKELYMEYHFNINKAVIYIKELKKEMKLNLIKKKIKKTDKLIEIEYLLDNKLYKYKIDME